MLSFYSAVLEEVSNTELTDEIIPKIYSNTVSHQLDFILPHFVQCLSGFGHHFIEALLRRFSLEEHSLFTQSNLQENINPFGGIIITIG